MNAYSNPLMVADLWDLAEPFRRIGDGIGAMFGESAGTVYRWTGLGAVDPMIAFGAVLALCAGLIVLWRLAPKRTIEAEPLSTAGIERYEKIRASQQARRAAERRAVRALAVPPDYSVTNR